MTTPINNRPAPAPVPTPAAAPAPAPAPAHRDAVALDTPTQTDAATFEGKSAPSTKGPFKPFGPPSPPRLRDERDAMSPHDLERIRNHNESLIGKYNEDYASYLFRYMEGVEAAPNLDRVRAFGPPARYDIGVHALPVSQRAGYDSMLDQHLDSAIDVRKAIGERELKEKGHATPGFFGFAEAKTGMFGQTAKQRYEIHEDGTAKTKTTLGFSASTPTDTPVGKLKLQINHDPETGKTKTELSSKLGNVGVAADTGGKITSELGGKLGGSAFGEEASLGFAGGQSFDGGARRAEVFVKVNGKVGDFEGEVKVGGGYQFLTDEYVADALDANDKDFFDNDNDDDAQVRALRSGGR